MYFISLFTFQCLVFIYYYFTQRAYTALLDVWLSMSRGDKAVEAVEAVEAVPGRAVPA